MRTRLGPSRMQPSYFGSDRRDGSARHRSHCPSNPTPMPPALQRTHRTRTPPPTARLHGAGGAASLHIASEPAAQERQRGLPSALDLGLSYAANRLRCSLAGGVTDHRAGGCQGAWRWRRRGGHRLIEDANACTWRADVAASRGGRGEAAARVQECARHTLPQTADSLAALRRLPRLTFERREARRHGGIGTLRRGRADSSSRW